MAIPGDSQNRILTELLAATARGDKPAYSRLYRLTSPKLYAVALRILKTEGPAQDCLQEAFLSVWRQAAGYQRGKAAPMTWLVTIVRNRALDMLRRQRHELLVENVEMDLLIAPDTAVPFDRMAIDKCLHTLKQDQRDCIMLAYFAGLTHPELAERLDRPVGTIKTWIRRGLERLRQCLQA
ncbi:MAG TPA: sigma-70 family RNA polymerase sigma factor [Chromatiales bacterium]|nr:sigma-70 family RNA polymerase sigma factor [Chromatiales bacterium]